MYCIVSSTLSVLSTFNVNVQNFIICCYPHARARTCACTCIVDNMHVHVHTCIIDLVAGDMYTGSLKTMGFTNIFSMITLQNYVYV